MAPSTPKKPAKGASRPKEPLHSAASKDIWLAGLGAMAQAQAAAQEQIHEAAAHFNQLTQGLSAGLAQPMAVKVDRLEHLFEDRVARALKSLGLPTAQEVADLQMRVAALEAALGKSATPAKPKAPPRKRPSAKTTKASQ
ncbi:MAG: phasin family protein [Burkholderiales bacterium]|jgi:BMFP domain-containing protein YqiC